MDDQLRAVWRANLPEPATEPEDEIVTPVSPGTEPDGPPGPQARRPTAPPNAPLGPLKARQVSRTDPAAALVSRDKVPPGLSDQVPVGVAGGAGRLITAREVTSGEVGDEQLLGRRLRDHVGTTGRTVTEVVAETQDGTQAHSRAREDQRLLASIRPCPGGGTRRASGRDGFTADPTADRSLGPAGQTLRRMGRTHTGTPLGGFHARADPPVCATCLLKPECRGTAAARTITRPDAAGLHERVRAHLATRRAKRRLRRRSCWVETVNAEVKEPHGPAAPNLAGAPRSRSRLRGPPSPTTS